MARADPQPCDATPARPEAPSIQGNDHVSVPRGDHSDPGRRARLHGRNGYIPEVTPLVHPLRHDPHLSNLPARHGTSWSKQPLMTDPQNRSPAWRELSARQTAYYREML